MHYTNTHTDIYDYIPKLKSIIAKNIKKSEFSNFKIAKKFQFYFVFIKSTYLSWFWNLPEFFNWSHFIWFCILYLRFEFPSNVCRKRLVAFSSAKNAWAESALIPYICLSQDSRSHNEIMLSVRNDDLTCPWLFKLYIMS